MSSYFESQNEPVKVEKWKLDDFAYKPDYPEFKTSMLYGFRYSGMYYAEDIRTVQYYNAFGSATVIAD